MHYATVWVIFTLQPADIPCTGVTQYRRKSKVWGDTTAGADAMRWPPADQTWRHAAVITVPWMRINPQKFVLVRLLPVSAVVSAGMLLNNAHTPHVI